MKKQALGITLVILLTIIAKLLHLYLFKSLETITIGILIGMLVANLFLIRDEFKPGIKTASKKFLNIGIILMGVSLNFNLIFDLGYKILILIIILISIGLLVANYLGKKNKLNSKISTLIGVGSTICGASAIVAMGPVINAEDEDVSISVAVISLLGVVGVLFYSWVANTFPISDIAYGIWSGSSLQGVSHAIAAASARGSDSISLEIGTLVKMTRVTLLAPLAFVLSKLMNDKNTKTKVKFPKYVIYFILVGFLFSINDKFNIIDLNFNINNLEFNLKTIFKTISDWLILAAMVAMGLKTNIRTLKEKGLPSLKTGFSVFAIISTSSALLIYLLIV